MSGGLKKAAAPQSLLRLLADLDLAATLLIALWRVEGDLEHAVIERRGCAVRGPASLLVECAFVRDQRSPVSIEMSSAVTTFARMSTTFGTSLLWSSPARLRSTR